MATVRDPTEAYRGTGMLHPGAAMPSPARDPAATLAPDAIGVLTDALALLGASGASLAVLDPTSGELVMRAATGHGSPPIGARVPLGQGFSGWAAVHRQALIVADAARDQRQSTGEGLRQGAVACVPVFEGSLLAGALIATCERAGAFGAQHRLALGALARYAGLALGRDRAASAGSAQSRELATLVEVARTITALREPREIFANIATGLARIIEYDNALIMAHDDASHELRVVGSRGAHGVTLSGTRVSMSDASSLSVRVAQQRRPWMYAPEVAGPPTGQITESFLGGEDLALLCVPLLSKDQLRGVATLARRHPFTPADLGALADLAPLIATAIENAGLYSAVKAEQEQLAAIFAGTADGLCVIDGLLRVTRANAAFARLANHPPAALAGETLLAIFTQGVAMPEPARSQLNRLFAATATALQSGAPSSLIECEFPGAGGELRTVLASVAPIAVPGGFHGVIVARDITDLRAVDRMKARFLQMISHEIRSPLHALNGYLDVALRASRHSETPATDLIRRARASGKHLAARVKDLLLLAHADAGAFVIEREDCDLARVLTEAVEETHLLAVEQGVVIHLHMSPSLPSLAGDTERLSQVARNLLHNALKFTPHGGHVLVEARMAGPFIEFSVSDTGCGIASEHLTRIFERFYQVPSGHGRTSGQGLGLAIVHTIVERHGGSVVAQSTPGQGSRFIVRLPVVSDNDGSCLLGQPQTV